LPATEQAAGSSRSRTTASSAVSWRPAMWAIRACRWVVLRARTRDRLSRPSTTVTASAVSPARVLQADLHLEPVGSYPASCCRV
jgi:hypothetical protein